MAADGVKLEQSSSTNAILSGIYSDWKPLGRIIIVYNNTTKVCEDLVVFGRVFKKISAGGKCSSRSGAVTIGRWGIILNIPI